MINKMKQVSKAFATCGLLLAGTLSAHDAAEHRSSEYSFDTRGHATNTSIVPVQTGSAGFMFNTVPGWGKIPNNDYIGSTHGSVVVDKQGLVYVSTDGPNNLAVFNSDGKFVKSFGKHTKRFHGMTIVESNGEEFIYGASMSKVVKVNLKSEAVLTLEGAKQTKGNQWKRATAVAVAPNGDIYIADGYGSSRIFQYNSKGEFIRTFGIRGKKDGQFVTSHGLIIDSRNPEKPVLLVADRENRRLQVFDLNGKFIKVAVSGLRRPCALSIWKDYVAVAELEGRVVILDKDFKIVSKLGDNPNKKQWAKFPIAPKDWNEGIFTSPHGCSFDKDGNIYVMDWNKWGRVTKLKKSK